MVHGAWRVALLSGWQGKRNRGTSSVLCNRLLHGVSSALLAKDVVAGVVRGFFLSTVIAVKDSVLLWERAVERKTLVAEAEHRLPPMREKQKAGDARARVLLFGRVGVRFRVLLGQRR